MAVKNLVITEHAFKIDVEVSKDYAILSCPRCGHKQERKPRSICASCKRFIPHGDSRQSWDDSSTNRSPYTSAFLKENAEVQPGVQIKTRHKNVALLRAVREFGIFGVVIAVVGFSAPWVGNAMLGKAGMAKLQRTFVAGVQTMTFQHSNKQIASKSGHSVH